VRIDSLQAGRGLAALAVIAGHANLASRDFTGVSVPLLDYGWLGVDFFFVLSGFIISWSAPGKAAGNFAWHRFRRVVLPYLPMGVGMGLLYALFPGISAGSHDWSWLPTLTLLPVNASPALSVAWTLQHEMLFYGLFLAFCFSGRFALGFTLWALAIACALIFNVDWLALRPINLEFLFGVVACWAVRRGIGDWRWVAIGAVPLAAWFMLGLERAWSPLVGLAIAFALPPLVRAEQRGAISVHGIFVFLGGASYSLYLAHGIAISLAARVVPSLPVIFAAGIAGGLAYYFAVERPILRYFRTALFAPHSIAKAAAPH
jgi:peptidoglycan/LPS O-acetylase OafA/YrhL